MNRSDYFKAFDEELIGNPKPSDFFYNLIKTKTFPTEKPFTMLYQLIKTEQNPKYHPEGNVFNHTMQVVDQAAIFREKSQDMRVFMWTALLHDIGKATTTAIRKGKITSYNHDIEGANMAKEFLLVFEQPPEFINDIQTMVRWHMQPLFVAKNLSYGNLKKMLLEVSAAELGLFSLCDRLGRLPMPMKKQEEEYQQILFFLDTCKKNTQNKGEKSHIDEISVFINSIFPKSVKSP